MFGAAAAGNIGTSGVGQFEIFLARCFRPGGDGSDPVASTSIKDGQISVRILAIFEQTLRKSIPLGTHEFWPSLDANCQNDPPLEPHGDLRAEWGKELEARRKTRVVEASSRA